MFEKKPEVNPKAHNIEAELKEVLNSEDKKLQLDFESFRRRIQPAIAQKTMEIQAEKRRRNEVIQLAIGYGIAIILTPFLILDYMVNGLQGKILVAVLVMMIFSFTMLSCSPLIGKFKKNTH